MVGLFKLGAFSISVRNTPNPSETITTETDDSLEEIKNDFSSMADEINEAFEMFDSIASSTDEVIEAMKILEELATSTISSATSTNEQTASSTENINTGTSPDDEESALEEVE